MASNSLIMQPTNSLKLPPLSSTRPRRKQKVLVWSDSVTATTGFGVVSKHILNALYRTGLYEIDQLAINYFGDFYDKNKIPYCIVPSKLGNPKDAFGNQMFIDALRKKDYDIVFVVNDTFVVEQISHHINKVRQAKHQAKRPVFKLIYYYPVDCRLLSAASNMIKIADRSVAYTNFAKTASEAVDVHPTDVIYHGSDIKNFKPIGQEAKTKYRKEYLGLKSDDTFVIVNVNRNSLRKDIAKTIFAFSEFRKQVPDSLLYLHTVTKDGSNSGHLIDLKICLEELGLNPKTDVLFPTNYNAALGYTTSILNKLYNCGDAYMTTHLGEGFGLTIVEAMAAGIPVIVPNNTTTPELVGGNRNRGYVYPCHEMSFVDNSGFRRTGRIEDIVDTMVQCHQDWQADRVNSSTQRQEIIGRATKFTNKYSWNNICKKWVKLFAEIQNANPKIAFKTSSEGEVL